MLHGHISTPVYGFITQTLWKCSKHYFWSTQWSGCKASTSISLCTLRQQQKSTTAYKLLHFAFVDHEEALNRLQRKCGWPRGASISVNGQCVSPKCPRDAVRLYAWKRYHRCHFHCTPAAEVHHRLQTASLCLRRPWGSPQSSAKEMWLASGSLDIGEWAVRVIQGMYSNIRNCVWVNGQYSEEIGVEAGMHHCSVLSPLLFILALEALSREFHTGVTWELVGADDQLQTSMKRVSPS